MAGQRRAAGGGVRIERALEIDRFWRHLDGGEDHGVRGGTRHVHQAPWNGIVLFGFEDSGKVYRSTDYGLTWNAGTRINEHEDYPELLVEGTRLWLPVATSLYASDDGGATWTKAQGMANVTQIYRLCKNHEGVIISLGAGGYAFWGYEFNA